MLICGLQRTTLLDFPGHVAATLFTGGCNFRCPYCHNADLVGQPRSGKLTEGEVWEFLKKRQGLLEGVCITGGEPTLQQDLKQFIEKIKELGYLVKLDSNGYRPDVLRDLMENGLLDYVAMDVKASRENYAKVTGVLQLDVSKIEESMTLLMGQDRIPYEFRTTLVEGLHAKEEMEAIGKWLAGARVLYLQSYRESENILRPDAGFQAFLPEDLKQMAEMARKYIVRVEVRGVE